MLTLADVEEARARIAGGSFREALAAGVTDEALARSVVGEGLEVLARQPIAYVCNCSRERAVNAVSALGPDGIRSVIANEKQVVIDCEFCKRRYVIDEAELASIARALEVGAPGGAKA